MKSVDIFLLGVAILGIILASIFLIIFVDSLISGNYSLYDYVFSILFLAAQLFFILQLYYFITSFLVSSLFYKKTERGLARYTSTPVAILISTYAEPLEEIEKTIISAVKIDYKNKKLYLQNDNQDSEYYNNLKKLCSRYDVVLFHRSHRRGYKAGALNDALKKIKEEFILFLDADQRPDSNILKDVMPLFAENENLAFIQTPQRNDNNIKVSEVAFGAHFQQIPFYEITQKSKSIFQASFCVGTNFIARRRALLSVGGFDEESITEDLATAMKLHLKGWESLYYGLVYVHGDSPETIPEYIRQQWRWAKGTWEAFFKYLKLLFEKQFLLKLHQWVEYFFATSYYFLGFAWIIFLILPFFTLAFDVKPLIAKDPHLFLLIYFPYTIFPWFFYILCFRKHKGVVRGLFLSHVLHIFVSPAYVDAFFKALFSVKTPFISTKGGKEKVDLANYWPQILLVLLNFVSMLILMVKIFTLQANITHFIVGFWAFINFIYLSYGFKLLYKYT